MMTKAWSPTEERRVAGMTSEDDAAECRCFWPGYIGHTPHVRWQVSGSGAVDALEYHRHQFKSNLLWDTKPVQLT